MQILIFNKTRLTPIFFFPIIKAAKYSKRYQLICYENLRGLSAISQQSLTTCSECFLLSIFIPLKQIPTIDCLTDIAYIFLQWSEVGSDDNFSPAPIAIRMNSKYRTSIIFNDMFRTSISRRINHHT